MPLPARLVLATRLVAALLLSMTTPTVTNAADSPPALEGTAWTLASLPGRNLVPDRPTTLRFERGRAAGTDGCNTYSAAYSSVAPGRILLGAVAQTQMACPSEPGKQAQAFMAALTNARATRLDGGRLVLLDAAGAVLATLAAQGDSLAGTSWQLTGYNNGKQAVVSVLRETALSVEFGADGRLSGAAGCNRYTGTYTQSKAAVAIGPLATTRRLCAQPAGVMEQEAAFLKALQSATRARLDGNRLELRRADDSLAVSAIRSTAGGAPPVTGAVAGGTAADVAATESGKRQTFAADMVYMADAAVVTVCVTGRRYPVAMEGDYLKMERAYTAQAQPSGSPLHVTFDGAIVQRPKMEGGGTEATIVVQRFINTWPGETCERARADANLANTYWKIARLGTTDVKTATGQREPHLLIRSPAKDGLQGDYSATVGCNTIRGSYAAAGATLKFSPGASTRMACAPPLDALERQLGDLLARTARWSVKANTLELFDAGGGALGFFQAVYF